MATKGEVHGKCLGSVGSEDLDQLKCQPCLGDGNLREAVGICIDCQEYLCTWCFKVHTVPKPTRSHQLLDKEQMLQGQIRTSSKDVCTETCSVHEGDIIKYYCTTHYLLGCTVCIALGHVTCKSVHYIPHVAKELSSNEEYRQVESQLKSALEGFEKVAENAKQNIDELGTSCNDALDRIKEYRRKVEEALDNIKAELIEQANAIKSKEINDLAAICDKYKSAHKELQTALAKIEALRNSKQNCSLYIEMMRMKDKLKSMDDQIKETEVGKLYRECQVKFSPNQGILDSLKNSEAFGTMLGSGKGAIVNRFKATIVNVKHACDIKVKTKTDYSPCWITGLVVLRDDRLVLADGSINFKIKTVNVQSGQVLAELKLSSRPWDVAALNHNKVVVTLPDEKIIAILTVGDSNLSIDNKLSVSGACDGVDYRNGKLAVSFRSPDKVQVLNLQGTVLYTISADKQGKDLFCTPQYLTFGQDDTTLYVSNYGRSYVLCLKLDGTVEATYTDSDLFLPLKIIIDTNSNVYVCALDNHLHQISKDCKNIKVLLNQDDGLREPYSICMCEEEDKFYVGMRNNDNVSVYDIERRQ